MGLGDQYLRVGTKSTRWLIFSIGLGMFPILANGLVALAARTFVNPSVLSVLTVLLGKGEMLILAAGITATAIGDLALAELAAKYKRLTTVLSGWAILNLLVASFYFGLVSQGYEGGVLVVSLFSYASAVLCGGWCVLLSERGERDVGHH